MRTVHNKYTSSVFWLSYVLPSRLSFFKICAVARMTCCPVMNCVQRRLILNTLLLLLLLLLLLFVITFIQDIHLYILQTNDVCRTCSGATVL